MREIFPDAISLTTHHLHLCFHETDAVLASGTGFIYRKDEGFYLVTAWHNLTGRDPITGECLSKKTAAIPDVVSTMFRERDKPANCRREHLPLYRDSTMREAVWFEHPTFRQAVDVAVLPLPRYITERYSLFPINAVGFDSFKEWVADDAFVIGYPFSQLTHLQFPIWKRASIASEPDVDLDGLPKVLVDTATRSGLSGSPVVMQRVGIHGASDGALSGSEIIGRIRNFIGVYSGRIGVHEVKAQLGIVWKARVIDEIIAGAVFGAAS